MSAIRLSRLRRNHSSTELHTYTDKPNVSRASQPYLSLLPSRSCVGLPHHIVYLDGINIPPGGDKAKCKGAQAPLRLMQHVVTAFPPSDTHPLLHSHFPPTVRGAAQHNPALPVRFLARTRAPAVVAPPPGRAMSGRTLGAARDVGDLVSAVAGDGSPCGRDVGSHVRVGCGCGELAIPGRRSRHVRVLGYGRVATSGVRDELAGPHARYEALRARRGGRQPSGSTCLSPMIVPVASIATTLPKPGSTL